MASSTDYDRRVEEAAQAIYATHDGIRACPVPWQNRGEAIKDRYRMVARRRVDADIRAESGQLVAAE